MMISAQDLETMSGMLRANGVEPTTLHTPAGSYRISPGTTVMRFGAPRWGLTGRPSRGWRQHVRRMKAAQRA